MSLQNHLGWYHKHLLTETLRTRENFIHGFLIFHTEQVYAATDEILQFIKSQFEQYTILRSSELMKEYWHPYAPFLDDIISGYSKYSEDEINALFEKLCVFYNHRPILSALIRGTNPKRQEDILEDEIFHEKDAIIETVIRLFLYFHRNEKLVLIIDNFYTLPPSSQEILLRLSKKKGTNFVIIIVFNKDKDCDVRDDFIHFRKKIEQKTSILFLEEVTTNSNMRHSDISLEKEQTGIQSDSLFKKLDLAFTLLAFDDCKHLCGLLAPMQDNLPLNMLFRFHLAQGKTYLMNHEFTQAGTSITFALKLAEELGDNEAMAEANYWLGLASYLKGDLLDTRNHGFICTNAGEELNNKVIELRGRLLLFISSDNDFNNRNTRKQWEENFNRLTSIAEELNWSNTQIYCYTGTPFVLGVHFTPYYNKLLNCGIDMAIEKKYYYRLSWAYQGKSVAYAIRGKYSSVLKYYLKSLHYKKLVKDFRGLTYIYNGIGSYYNYIGNYREAVHYHFLALKYLRKNLEYKEVISTLMNLGMCSFVCANDKMALYYLVRMNKLSKLNGIDGIMGYTKELQDLFLALVYALNGRYVDAYHYYCLIKDKDFQSPSATAESHYFFLLLKTLFSVHENDANNVEKNLTTIEEILLNSSQQYHLLRFYYQAFLIYQELKMTSKSIEALTKGQQKAEELQNVFFISLFEKLSIGRKINLPSKKWFRPINISAWVQASYLQININELRRRINEINLLNKLRKFYVLPDSSEQLLLRVMCVLKEDLSLTAVYLYRKENNAWFFKKGTDSSIELPQDKLEVYFRERSRKILLKRKGECADFPGMNSVLFIPMKVENEELGLIFTVTEKYSFEISKDCMKILNIVVQQLELVLEKKMREDAIIEKNKRLEKDNKELKILANTDRLTGVNNRQALQLFLKRASEHFLLQGNTSGISALFLDLDNFKYYNDTFGHNLGDFLLIQFTRVLMRNVRSVDDFVARFGGDEFIIVLPDTSQREAVSVAKRILADVEKSDHFIPVICEYLGYIPDIPDECKLSVSIGISTYKTIEGIENLIPSADKALYEAKRGGKSRFSVFQEENKE